MVRPFKFKVSLFKSLTPECVLRDLGKFSAIKHTIDTGGAKPVRQKMRRTPLGFEKEKKSTFGHIAPVGNYTALLVGMGVSPGISP